MKIQYYYWSSTSNNTGDLSTNKNQNSEFGILTKGQTLFFFGLKKI